MATFDLTATWNNGAGTILAGDTVFISGTITSQVRARGSGSVGNLITVDLSGATITYNTSPVVDFTGYDYVRIQNVTIPSGTSITGSWLEMGASSGNPSTGCELVGLTSVLKTGSNAVNTDYTQNCLLENLSITQFTGNGISTSTNCDGLTIRNSSIETLAAGHNATTDCIKLGWSTNVIIEGCRIRLLTSKSGGDPHNDGLQAWHNYSDTSQRPTAWTIRNNFFEIADVTGGAFNNFTMIQWPAGVWTVHNNIFYSHGLSSGTGNGCNFSRHDVNTFDLRITNNTFISDSGLITQVTANNSGGDNLQHTNALTIKNNIFISVGGYSGDLIVEGISDAGGTVTANYNAYSGWTTLIQQVSYATSSDVGSTNLGANSFLISDINAVLADLPGEDFRLASGSAAIDQGETLTLNTGLSEGTLADWPNPATVSRPVGAAWDIGAYEGDGAGGPAGHSNNDLILSGTLTIGGP